MLLMTYSRAGEPVNDFRVENLYKLLRAVPDGQVWRVAYSTTNIFHRIRLGVARDEVDHRQVVFHFEGEGIAINEFGACLVWPEGFLEQAEYCAQILSTAVDKSKGLRQVRDAGEE